AALEATAYQTLDLAEAMLADTGLEQLGELRADGGMTKMDSDERAKGVAAWRRGVDRTLGLTEADRD
ncbi:MAG TPA: hypothetical protein VHM94_11985, partial [Acidimicrobiia bacterium]|nr:hypothetical protein [Acidimicrobiia bacterium]